jgi:hypothetical protein
MKNDNYYSLRSSLSIAIVYREFQFHNGILMEILCNEMRRRAEDGNEKYNETLQFECEFLGNYSAKFEFRDESF